MAMRNVRFATEELRDSPYGDQRVQSRLSGLRTEQLCSILHPSSDGMHPCTTSIMFAWEFACTVQLSLFLHILLRKIRRAHPTPGGVLQTKQNER